MNTIQRDNDDDHHYGGENTFMTCISSGVGAGVMMKIDQLDLDILQYVLGFLPRSNRKTISIVSRIFSEARFLLEKHEMIQMWNDENNCLMVPLSEPVVSEKVIEKRQEELGVVFPFHLKLFLTVLSNGRKAWTDNFVHVSNLLGPVESWKVDPQNGNIVLGVDTRFSNVLTLSKDLRIRVNRDTVKFSNFVTMIDRPFKPEFYKFEKFKERKYFPFSMSKGPYSILPLEYKLLDKLSIESIRKDPKCYAYVPDHIKRMRRIAKEAFLTEPSMGTMIPKELLEDSSFIREIYAERPIILQYASPNGSWWSDRDLMIDALNHNTTYIRKCSEEIRNDREIIDMIIERDARNAFKYIGKFKEDVDIVKRALVNSNFTIFDYIPQNFLVANRDVVLMILEKEGRYLEKMSYIFKNDKECFFLAARSCGIFPGNQESYYKITEKDKEDVKSVLKYNPFFLEKTIFAQDRDLFKESLLYNGRLLCFACKKFKEDKELVLTAVRTTGKALFYASEKLKDDEEVVLAAVMNDGKAISFASKRLSSNRKIIQARKL